jgi:hypothetical protein
MNMQQAKIQTAPVNVADVLGVLDRRLRELDARRGIITDQIIHVEKTVGTAAKGVGVDAEKAQALLDGAKFIASHEKPISQLAALYAERDTIDAALKIGRSKRHRLATERATEIWASCFPEIAEIEKRRVMLALQLQRVNRERELLREKISKKGGAGFLSTDGVELLGFHDMTEVEWAAKRLIADGIATCAHVERWKNG